MKTIKCIYVLEYYIIIFIGYKVADSSPANNMEA